MRRVVVVALAGWLGLVQGAVAQEPRYDAATQSCRPHRQGVIDRQWQMSAPRNPLRIGQPIAVGLREKYAGAGQRRLVRARIVGAATLLESKAVAMVDDNYASVEFPRDFRPTQALGPGAYTVLWLLAEGGGGFLACDGFVIR
ncbi:MAG: hypothetical protein JO055_16035 [Alphaproteobacteria bacterium]|nr:hypothetical protein [Alphaproteobacteria bacterium]